MKNVLKKIPIKSFTDIQRCWKDTDKLSLRDKYTAYRSIGFDIKNAYTSATLSLQELKTYVDILKVITRMPNRPSSLVLLLNKIYGDWLTATGNGHYEIIQKKAKKIQVYSGLVDITDSNQTAMYYSNQKNHIEHMNNGKRFSFSTGGDGLFNVQCRIIKGNEPLLTIKEYKCCRNSTDTAVIAIPSGKLIIGCLSSLGEPNNSLCIEVNPGNYKVAAYLFCVGDKFESFYVVLSETTAPAVNQLVDITDLSEIN